MSGQHSHREVSIEVSNVGGIDETAKTFEPGVTVLSGRNATNRTSFLTAVMAALGSEQPSLKADADSGSVELQIGARTYTRTLRRTPDGVEYGGDPYADDTTAADHFAFLLGDNSVRQAIRAGADPVLLRELVMDPVDVESLDREKRDLQRRIRSVEADIESLAEAEAALLPLREQREELAADLAAVEEEIDEVEAAIGAADAELGESQERRAAFESVVETLQTAREDLADAEYDLDTEREALASLRDERESVRAELDDLDLPDADAGDLAAKRRELEREREAVQQEVGSLTEVVQFNEELLSGDRDALAGVLDEGRERDAADLTGQLVEGAETTCWTCGQRVSTDRVEETVELLRRYREDRQAERDRIAEEIEAVEAEQRRVEQRREERDRLEKRLEELDREVDESERTVESLEARVEELEATIQDAQARADDLETGATEQRLLDLRDKRRELSARKDRLADQLAAVEDDIEGAEADLDRRDDLVAERDRLREQLRERRTAIERLETQAVEAFNEHTAELLSLLEYDNIARVRLERRTISGGSGPDEETAFHLEVSRETAAGTVVADDVGNLSESEREVVGLVFGLAGFLAHEVYEEMPFVLLDSLEAIDAERIALVVDYFTQFSEYILAALLPEDTPPTADLAATATRLTDI